MTVARRTPRLLVFSYHKTGTSLFLGVMTKVARLMNLRLANLYGPVRRLPAEADIVLLPHSLLFCPLPADCRAIRVVRDPRDIWVSGYLYHRHCQEPWCLTAGAPLAPPILVPWVDHAFMHWPEAAKAAFLRRLKGKSYQRNLLERSRAEGLDFELAGYTAATLAAMEAWTFPRVLDVRLEDLMGDFDRALSRVFAHFEFNDAERQAALAVVGEEDVRRMDDAAVAARPQIHSRTVSKWREVLSDDQARQFEHRYGGLIRRLGYQGS